MKRFFFLAFLGVVTSGCFQSCNNDQFSDMDGVITGEFKNRWYSLIDFKIGDRTVDSIGEHVITDYVVYFDNVASDTSKIGVRQPAALALNENEPIVPFILEQDGACLKFQMGSLDNGLSVGYGWNFHDCFVETFNFIFDNDGQCLYMVGEVNTVPIGMAFKPLK